MNSGFVGWSLPANLTQPYICVQDQKAQNTAGGTFTSGAWRTRDLNTIVSDGGGLITASNLVSNLLTLPAGRWRTSISAPAILVNAHKARLRDITTGVTLLLGTSENGQTNSSQTQRSVIVGTFEFSVPHVISVEHQCATTGATFGFGPATNFDVELFTIAEFWRLP